MHKYQVGQKVIFQNTPGTILELLPHEAGQVPHYAVEVKRKREKPELHHAAESNLALPQLSDD